jgi:hypothetical protein
VVLVFPDKDLRVQLEIITHRHIPVVVVVALDQLVL